MQQMELFDKDREHITYIFATEQRIDINSLFRSFRVQTNDWYYRVNYQHYCRKFTSHKN